MCAPGAHRVSQFGASRLPLLGPIPVMGGESLSDPRRWAVHNEVMRQPGPAVGLDDVAELRALLRRRDRTARQIGLALLRSWSAGDLDDVGARAVLEAAGGSYPTLQGSLEHPAELLARMLWDAPQRVEVVDVARVYLVAGERARRALVHLLALRGDADGLEGLEFVVGEEAPAELLPVPTTPLLDPLLGHPDRARVADLLAGLLPRSGWTWHAADLLVRLESAGASSDRARAILMARVTSAAAELVDACNRGALVDPRSGDGARTERQALASLVWLLDELADQDVDATLAAMLGSSDPRVAAMAAARLLGRGAPVAPERLELIARDPVARADLHDGLVALSPPDAGQLDEVQVAEGELARWLCDITELGRVPDEMEPIATVPHPGEPSRRLHLFRFRMRAPHWSAARGWMVGIGGTHTYSCYSAEDECSLADHVTALLAALAEWPDRRDDGAA